ncbi:MAG: hypothetical protein ACLT46_03410 [Hungatella sp.]
MPNEYAVSQFLKRRIPYPAITEMIEKAMEEHRLAEAPTVDEILEAEAATYELLSNGMN